MGGRLAPGCVFRNDFLLNNMFPVVMLTLTGVALAIAIGLVDEINRYSSRTHLYEKGYYDGMFYILMALKKSKELLMATLNREINTKL